MSGKRPRWEEEMFSPEGGPNAAACGDCRFRACEFRDGDMLDRAGTCSCMIFEDPEIKAPDDVHYIVTYVRR